MGGPGTGPPTSSAPSRVPAPSSLPGDWLSSLLVSCLACHLFCALSQVMDSGLQATSRAVTHTRAQVPPLCVMLCSRCFETLHHFEEGLAFSFCTDPLPQWCSTALVLQGLPSPSRTPRTLGPSGFALAVPSVLECTPRCSLPTQMAPSLGAFPDHSINRALLTLPIPAPTLLSSVSREPSQNLLVLCLEGCPVIQGCCVSW